MRFEFYYKAWNDLKIPYYDGLKPTIANIQPNIKRSSSSYFSDSYKYAGLDGQSYWLMSQNFAFGAWYQVEFGNIIAVWRYTIKGVPEKYVKTFQLQLTTNSTPNHQDLVYEKYLDGKELKGNDNGTSNHTEELDPFFATAVRILPSTWEN